jgi:hypothetical protein
VHGVYDGFLVVYIYQLTSALSNLGRFVIIDLSSLSFVVLEIPTASAVSNLVTYYYYSPVLYVGLRLESSSILRTSTLGTAFALHSRIRT